MFKAALLLLVGSAFAEESPIRSELERDALWGRDSIAESDAQFGIVPRSKRRWDSENPTGHNDDDVMGKGLIQTLSESRWADRGLPNRVIGRNYRAINQRMANFQEPRIARAQEAIERGQYDIAHRRMVYFAKWAPHYGAAQLRRIHALMGELAAAYVQTGELERAVRIYEEMLLVGRYLPPEHTAGALNKLIATHFDLGDYETALMYVRVGVAVLDDDGIGPYRAMNRIIGEMSSLETAVDALEQDFDTALADLEAAVASAEDDGLIVGDQWWAPVYLARQDREEAIRILRTMLAPMRDDSGDILREDAEHEESVP